MRLKGVILSMVCAGGLFAVGTACAATPEEALADLEQTANYGKQLKEMLGERARNVSSGGQFIINLGEKWDKIKPVLGNALKQGVAPREVLPEVEALLEPNKSPSVVVTNGSNPASAHDNFSNFGGFTQSETSVAWWNTTAIAAFNDSGSFMFTSLFTVNGGNKSFNGWARSTNANLATPTWTDMGALVPPALTGGDKRDAFGDPVARSTRASTFYQASLGNFRSASGNLSEIIVFRSTNGGITFPVCTRAASGPVATTFLDKEWMAVKPGSAPSTDILHVVYTRFVGSVTNIEYVRSINGGATWSAPFVMQTVSGSSFLQFGMVAIRPGTSTVYCAWEQFASGTGIRTMRIKQSINNGATWGPTVNIGTIARSGDGFALDFLQGIFRSGMEFSGLAVNPVNGHVYVCYHQGEFTTPDPFGSGGLYRYSGIYFSRSINGGATWSAPIRVNNDAVASPFDQYQPGMAVTSSGKIGIQFYDRRSSGLNFNIQRFYASSINDGATWTNSPRTGLFPPIGADQDVFVNPVYMGDYDDPAADSSNTNITNIIGAFQATPGGNQDVFAEKLP